MCGSDYLLLIIKQAKRLARDSPTHQRRLVASPPSTSSNYTHQSKAAAKTKKPDGISTTVNGPIKLSQAIWKYPNLVDNVKISLVEKYIVDISTLCPPLGCSLINHTLM